LEEEYNMADIILVVEDEQTLQETLVYNLKHQGYQVEAVGDGIKAVEAARRLKPDLLVLDIMLPGMDGFEVTRVLRKEMNIPILMLTARDEEIDRVLGLEMGADDYLTKPFSMRELLARVKAQLRRAHFLQEEITTQPAAPSDLIRVGNLQINFTRHEVLLNGKLLALKPKEYDLLLYFAQHCGQVLSRDRILEQVWGWEYTGGTRTVDVHVRWLRSKIEQEALDPKRIITVRGVGYRFDG
jgi:DNA-binding response OmpR family regulator